MPESTAYQQTDCSFWGWRNKGLDVACSEELNFTAEEWKAKTEKEQQEILMNYRILT